MRLLVVSPVRNEAPHFDEVVAAMAAQMRPPDLWLIVDDGSTDGTTEIARRATERLPFVRVVAAPPQRLAHGADRLAMAVEAVAFNHGLREAGSGWDFVSKLDGDIVLSPEHYERLLREFDADPKLGLAGCYLEADGRIQEQPEYHVNGALKLYRRACLEGIEERQGSRGILERLGWDTIDETYARIAGWRTRSFRDLRAVHLKPSGSVGGLLRGRARHGECVWICHYPLWLVLARAAKLAASRPYVVGGASFLLGYLGAPLRRRARLADPEFRKFVRRELRGRLRRVPGAPSSRRAGSG